MSATIPNEIVGSPVLAADFNWLQGGVTNYRPQFFGVQNAVQSVANNSTAANLVLQNIVRDTDGAWSAGANAYTIATPGLWYWTATCGYAVSAVGNRGIQLILGASSYASWNFSVPSIDGNGHCTAAWAGVLPAGATVTATPFQTSGGALNTLGTAEVTMTGTWMSA